MYFLDLVHEQVRDALDLAMRPFAAHGLFHGVEVLAVLLDGQGPLKLVFVGPPVVQPFDTEIAQIARLVTRLKHRFYELLVGKSLLGQLTLGN